MKVLALAAIRFYQRNISPHKGFCCAYAACTGDASCSALGYRAISRYGFWGGLVVLDRRLARCGTAHRLAHRARPLALPGQAGFLDCGGCDVGGCDGVGCDMPCGGGGSSGNGLCSFVDACSGGGSCDRPRGHRASKGFRKSRLDNEEAIKRRSRILREASGPHDPPV